MSYIYIGQYYDKTDRPLALPYKKIGKSIDVPKRENSLNNTKGPIGYIMVAMWKVGEDYSKVEKSLHAILDNSRVDGEWFIDEDDTLLSRITEYMAINSYPNTLIEAQDEEEEKEREKIIRSAINLNWLGLNAGDKITFKKDQSITATIVNEKKINFNGKLTSLSTSAKLLLNVSAACGPDWWMYEEELLSERRRRMEREGTYGPQVAPNNE